MNRSINFENGTPLKQLVLIHSRPRRFVRRFAPQVVADLNWALELLGLKNADTVGRLASEPDVNEPDEGDVDEGASNDNEGGREETLGAELGRKGISRQPILHRKLQERISAAFKSSFYATLDAKKNGGSEIPRQKIVVDLAKASGPAMVNEGATVESSYHFEPLFIQDEYMESDAGKGGLKEGG